MSVAHKFFDKDESQLVVLALTAIEFAAPRDAAIIRAEISRLHHLSDIIERTGSLDDDRAFAGHTRTRTSLIECMSAIDGFTGEIELPSRATLSRTFLVLKIQLLRDLVKAASRQLEQNPEWDELDTRLRDELAQSIYTEMVEALLLSLLSERDLPRATRREAASQLLSIWNRAELEIDDFCPLLESTWRARNRVNADLGTLLGTSEYCRLVTADCAEGFLDFFARDDVTEAELQALAEFLLDLSFEEISELRQAMKRHGVSTTDIAWAEEVIGRPIEREMVQERIDPVTLRRSFYRRHRAADARFLTGAPGPRHTAEAYMLVHLLDNQARGSRG